MASPKKKWLRMKAKEDAAKAQNTPVENIPAEPEVLAVEVNNENSEPVVDNNPTVEEHLKELDQKAENTTKKRARRSRSVLGRNLKKK